MAKTTQTSSKKDESKTVASETIQKKPLTAKQKKELAEQEKAKKAAEMAEKEQQELNNDSGKTDEETEQKVPAENNGNEGQMKIDDEGNLQNPNLKDTAGKVEAIKFSRQTRIQKSSSDATIKSLYKEWKKDQLLKSQRKNAEAEAIKNNEPLPEGDDGTTLRFDLAIQRNETWSDYQKSDFIHSVIYGYYIPPVLVQDSNDGKKWFLDGKQRITTLMTYINGEWQLSKKTKTVYGYKIAGFKFKDLPEEMQEEIMDESITIVRMQNMTEVERDEMFVKQNSGSPLSRIEMTRAMHSELIESINEISNFKFFKEDIELSRKARVRFVDQEIILQIAMLMEEGKEKIKGFGAGHIEEYVLRLKEAEKTLSDELVKRFEDVSKYLNQAFEEYELDEVKKSLKRIHVPIIFWNAETAINEKLQPKLFGDFIRSFLISNYSVESRYGKSCQAGSSKKENVLTRLDEMSASLTEFIKMIKEAPNVESGVIAFDKHLADLNGIERQMDTDDVE